MTIYPLKYSEYYPYLKLLNRNGYVLDFSNGEFDQFTYSIVGVKLVEQYGLSKGKSLEKFLQTADRSDSLKLLRALMAEWELARSGVADASSAKLVKHCYTVLDTLSVEMNDDNIGEYLKLNGFTSEYLDEQRKLLGENIKTHPTASIGIAKELVESCCKTILEFYGVQFSNGNDLSKLVWRVVCLFMVGFGRIGVW